jgi:hypothetical protein
LDLIPERNPETNIPIGALIESAGMGFDNLYNLALSPFSMEVLL